MIGLAQLLFVLGILGLVRAQLLVALKFDALDLSHELLDCRDELDALLLRHHDLVLIVRLNSIDFFLGFGERNSFTAASNVQVFVAPVALAKHLTTGVDIIGVLCHCLLYTPSFLPGLVEIASQIRHLIFEVRVGNLELGDHL